MASVAGARSHVAWRGVLVALGTLSLVLGIVGIFVPLLPTTPFLLLASACYLRGSRRLHAWLLSHGRLGQYIRDFEAGLGIPLRAKVVALVMLWLSIGHAVTRIATPWMQVAAVLLATGVTLYLLRLPTRR
jgi:uncharacterized membrane protein YbaN (DUF454 family)